MLKYFSICATIFVLGTTSAHAQMQLQEAVLERIAVPGAAFDILVAVPKFPAAIVYITPEAAYIPLVGGELALAFESWEEFLHAVDELRWPVGAVYRSSATPHSAAIYVVPTDEQTKLSVR